VKALALAAAEGKPYAKTDPEEVFAGRYPLARYLYLYVNKAPNKGLDPLVREFLRYTLARDGQQVVLKDGYLPVPHRVDQEEHVKIQ
jgi:phosphate transport system substrate-binding protein